MRKFILITILLTIVVCCVICSNASSPQSPEKEVANRIAAQADTFSQAINRLLVVVRNRKPDSLQLRKLFLESRLAYKRFEWAAEYFAPAITRKVNGPASMEAEMSGFARQPAGLQVIESCLYPTCDLTKRNQIIYEAKSLTERAADYKSFFARTTISSPQIWEATKLQVFRVMALGVAGFDCQLAKNSISESASSLNAVSQILSFVPVAQDKNAVAIKFQVAESYLEKNPDFDNFNRAEFILSYGDPLSKAIADAQQQLNRPPVHSPQLLRQSAASLFDRNAFNVMAFSAYPDDEQTKEKIALGKKLFNDPSLSGTMTRSCASCHQAKLGYADGLVKNMTIDGTEQLKRNTPTLLNAAYQTAFFDDMRENTLESQTKSVIENKLEMHGFLAAISDKLSRDTVYSRLFETVYHHKQSTVTPKEVTSCITAYVRTLSNLNSRFDAYMQGEKSAMNKQEIDGFNLFMGKAKCGTCHYMPLFNGVLPPLYNRMDAEIIGVPGDAKGTRLDDDAGRNTITHSTADNHAFKTPTVRNAARTAPYMHNGVYAKLEEVIDFYDKGGGAGLNLKVPNQTLSAQPLHLTQKEKDDLVAFIKCLDNKQVDY